MPDSMKKEPTPYGVGSFFISSATSLSQVVSNEVRECTWLGYRPPRPVGETGGRYHLGESEAQRLFSDCPNQCAALYLVRILSAARCAGFRQAKSPGRVRSFRWKHCWSCFTTSLIRLRSTNRGLTRARSIGRAFIPWMTRIWLLPGVRWRSCKPGLTSPLSWNASRWTASIRQRNITRSIPNGYCHVSLGMIQKAKAWKPGDPTTL